MLRTNLAQEKSQYRRGLEIADIGVELGVEKTLDRAKQVLFGFTVQLYGHEAYLPASFRKLGISAGTRSV